MWLQIYSDILLCNVFLNEYNIFVWIVWMIRIYSNICSRTSHSGQDQNQTSKSTLKSIVWPARWLQHPECVSQHDRERKFQIEAAFGFPFPGRVQCTFRQSPIFREQSFFPFLGSPPMSRLTPCKVALFNVWPWDREAVVPACPPLYCHSSTSVRRLRLEMSQICSTCHVHSATVGNTSSKFCVKDVLFRCVSLGTQLCAIGDVLTSSCALERCSWCLLTIEAFHKDFSFFVQSLPLRSSCASSYWLPMVMVTLLGIQAASRILLLAQQFSGSSDALAWNLTPFCSTAFCGLRDGWR